MTHFLTLQPLEALFTRIREFTPLPAEYVPLEDCLGRTLAEEFTSPEELPGFNRSSVDGFAVRAKDLFGASEGAPALLDCIGECPMGEVSGLVLRPGSCARIWTGGMLPENANAAVMLEYARTVDEGEDPRAVARIELTSPVAPGDNILAHDEDARAGQMLVPAGRILRPQEIGLFAALGIEKIPVRIRPKIAVISTGDEVLPISAKPLPGQVRDVNSFTLTALARAAGAEARSFGLIRDDREALYAKILETLLWADALLVSGGSSAGRRDFTKECFLQVAGCEILAHGVAMSPGKPLIFARTGQKSLWGMPGHVASALVCAEVLLRPLIEQLLGREKRYLVSIPAELTRPVASAQGRRDFIRVALEPPRTKNGPPQARPLLGKSGLISTLVKADALAVCPEDREGLPAGTVPAIIPI